MGRMKDLLITIYNGGDEAVAAVERMGKDWREQLEQAAAEIERRWIPVGERLPPLMTEVLGWHPEDRVRAWFRHSGQPKDAPYWESWSPQDRECDDCKVDEPTHWATLPEPPAKKNSCAR